MPRALKVFATSAGFFQAVVATPSQKAALEAWGVRENLFATGAAQIVDDPELVRQALAQPGEIIRVPIAAHVDLVAAAQPPKSAARKAVANPPAKPVVDRSPVDRAEKALAEAEVHKAERARAVKADRAALDARAARESAEDAAALEHARRTLEAAKHAYEAALAR